QHRIGAAHDFHRLHVEGVDEVAAAIGNAFLHTRAIDQHLHAISTHAANGEAVELAERVGDRGGAIHAHARLVAHQILDVADHALVEILGGDDRNGHRYIEHLAGAARRGDAHALELGSLA